MISLKSQVIIPWQIPIAQHEYDRRKVDTPCFGIVCQKRSGKGANVPYQHRGRKRCHRAEKAFENPGKNEKMQAASLFFAAHVIAEVATNSASACRHTA